MRDYAKIVPTFWTGTTGKALRKSQEGALVALYLLSSPHSNMLGLYYQPVLYMAHETGLGIEGAWKGLRSCIEAGFCLYDEASEMVWVKEMAAYQIGEALKPADKRCAGIQKDYDALPDNPFLGMFYDRYRPAFHLSQKRVSSADPEPAYPSRNEAPSKPHRSQEQEQEQEQEQDKTNPPQPPVAGGCPGTLTEKKARVKSERMTLKTFLDRCRETGERPIGGYEPLQRYIAEAKLPVEFVNLAWAEFKRDFGPGGKRERKQQALWRRHFQNFVEGNFYRLWYAKPQGDGIAYELTTVGLQAQMATQTREAA